MTLLDYLRKFQTFCNRLTFQNRIRSSSLSFEPLRRSCWGRGVSFRYCFKIFSDQWRFSTLQIRPGCSLLSLEPFRRRCRGRGRISSIMFRGRGRPGRLCHHCHYSPLPESPVVYLWFVKVVVTVGREAGWGWSPPIPCCRCLAPLPKHPAVFLIDILIRRSGSVQLRCILATATYFVSNVFKATTSSWPSVPDGGVWCTGTATYTVLHIF